MGHKRPSNREPVNFERIGLCFFDVLEFRPPRKDEYFLSGAKIEAWQSLDDMICNCWIVRPTFKAVRKMTYVYGEPVTFS